MTAVTPERALDLARTRALVDAAAEAWLDSRVRGRVPPAVEAELTEAVAEYRKAAT